jgi:hypothetical protein
MKYKLIVLLLAAVFASGAAAKCDPKKAARNAAMDASVGISGRCDADSLAKDTKEDLGGNVKDSVDVDRDKHHKHRDGDKMKRKKNKD